MLSVVERVKKKCSQFPSCIFYWTEHTHTYTHSSASACDSVTSKVNLAKKVNSRRFSLFKFQYKSQNMCFRFA